MKTFNASQLSHARREIFEAARDDGATIQVKNTNGEVLEEFVMVCKDEYEWLKSRAGSYKI
tara:strand:- start:92 stop:274 length:183 start_codon:yes stop_codon:yes gene_type:complete